MVLIMQLFYPQIHHSKICQYQFLQMILKACLLLTLLYLSVQQIPTCQNNCLYMRGNCNSYCMGYDNTIAKYAVKYAGCSCVTNSYIQQIKDWNTKQCKAAQDIVNIQKDDIRVVQGNLDSIKKYNLLSLIVYDKQRNMVVVSFRGTVCGEDGANADIDFTAEQTPYNLFDCSETATVTTKLHCQVHKGFSDSYRNLADSGLNETFRYMITKYNPKKVLITGISLGGAIAALAAYDLSNSAKDLLQGRDLMVYTFGQPRLGNKDFAKALNQKLMIYRVVQASDAVPHMPPRLSQVPTAKKDIGGYYHSGVEVFYQKDNDKPFITAGDSDKSQSQKDLKQLTQFNLCVHLKYGQLPFGQSQCTSNYCRSDVYDIDKEMQLKEACEAVKLLKSLILSGKKIIEGCKLDPTQSYLIKCPKKHNVDQYFLERATQLVHTELAQQIVADIQQQQSIDNFQVEQYFKSKWGLLIPISRWYLNKCGAYKVQDESKEIFQNEQDNQL